MESKTYSIISSGYSQVFPVEDLIYIPTTGREGFFCLKSSKNLTLIEALQTYRKKDSIEKIFNSLKNEIEIKPLRLWTDNSIYGALIIEFIAQIFV